MAAEFYATPEAKRAGHSARTKVKRLAKKLNVTIVSDRGGGWDEITAEAPPKHVFTATGTHGVVAANAGPTFDGLWERILLDLEYGLMPCTDDDCEICEEERAS